MLSSRAEVIDLITPPPSPAPALVPSDDEDNMMEATGAGGGGEDEDDEVHEAAPPARALVRTAEDDKDEDGDVAFVGRVGDNALSDFPHSREFCLAFKFTAGCEFKKCDNCYCARVGSYAGSGRPPCFTAHYRKLW